MASEAAMILATLVEVFFDGLWGEVMSVAGIFDAKIFKLTVHILFSLFFFSQRQPEGVSLSLRSNFVEIR